MRTLAVDVETTKRPIMHPWQKEARLISVGLADETGWRKTWTLDHKELEAYESLDEAQTQREKLDEIQACINTANRLVGHNIKFDLNWLSHVGIEYGHCKVWCTQIAEYLLEAQRIGQLSLGDLSKKYLKIDKIDLVKTFWDAGYETDEIPLRILTPYLEQDCINALAIYQRQVPLIKQEKLQAVAAIQNQNVIVLSEIERNGMLLDVDEAVRHVKNLTLEIQVLDTDIMLAFGEKINLNSKAELSAALYGGKVKRFEEVWVQKTLKTKPETTYRMKLEPYIKVIKGIGFQINKKKLKTAKEGVYRTDKGTIQYLKAKTKGQRNLKKWLIQRSGADQALKTLKGKDGKGLLRKVQHDGLVHPQYNMTVTKTGRYSSKDPNGQNLPREGTSPIKLSFVSRLGKIMEVDISRAEWVAVAVLCRDPEMMREIHEGVDPHTENAIKFFKADPADGKKFDKIRTTAKIMTFRLIYGGSAYSFYMDPKMPNYSLKFWEEVVAAFYEKYKGLAAWQAENIRLVYRQQGRLVNPTGRIFRFYKGNKGYRPQQVKNFPVQSFATADIMPLATAMIYKEFKRRGFKSLLIGQVHDALIFDALESEMVEIANMCIEIFEKLPAAVMQLWPHINFDMPMTGDAEVGDSWGDLHKLKLAA
jgi:DNA polymerase-1